MTGAGPHEDARDEAHDLLRRAAGLLGTAPAGTAGARLTDLLQRSHDAVAAWGAAHPEHHLEATSLGTELAAAGLRLRTTEVVRRRDAAERLQSSLRHLQQFDSTSELAAQVPEEVARLGFNRVLFSWVDQARWVPVSFHTENGPDEARAVMAAGEPPYWDIHKLLEGQMLAHRRPMLVRNALEHPKVHQDIQAVMHSTSYVAAPVMRRAQVVGFVHADQNSDLGVVDELDRDLIHIFAEGLTLALDRVAMLEELAELRRRIGEQASSLTDLLAAPSAPAAPQALVAAAAPTAPWRQALTRREEEVLALVAAGLSNAQIAQRLYVTEGTAKTHLKNVLRKLGAENRAHAGALYHQHWRTPGG